MLSNEVGGAGPHGAVVLQVLDWARAAVSTVIIVGLLVTAHGVAWPRGRPAGPRTGMRALRNLSGLDAWSRPVFATRPKTARRFVAFEIQSRSLTADLHFWEAVAAATRSVQGLFLVGYCDGTACGRRLRATTPPPFPVETEAELLALQAVDEANQAGECIVTDGHSIEIRRLRWRGGAAPNAVAAEIRGAG